MNNNIIVEYYYLLENRIEMKTSKKEEQLFTKK
jgi:hypothetical protein